MRLVVCAVLLVASGCFQYYLAPTSTVAQVAATPPPERRAIGLAAIRADSHAPATIKAEMVRAASGDQAGVTRVRVYNAMASSGGIVAGVGLLQLAGGVGMAMVPNTCTAPGDYCAPAGALTIIGAAIAVVGGLVLVAGGIVAIVGLSRRPAELRERRAVVLDVPAGVLRF
jgi:hypothetical protein